jgi:hypothetical protein
MKTGHLPCQGNKERTRDILLPHRHQPPPQHCRWTMVSNRERAHSRKMLRKGGPGLADGRAAAYVVCLASSSEANSLMSAENRDFLKNLGREEGARSGSQPPSASTREPSSSRATWT